MIYFCSYWLPALLYLLFLMCIMWLLSVVSLSLLLSSLLFITRHLTSAYHYFTFVSPPTQYVLSSLYCLSLSLHFFCMFIIGTNFVQLKNITEVQSQSRAFFTFPPHPFPTTIPIHPFAQDRWKQKKKKRLKECWENTLEHSFKGRILCWWIERLMDSFKLYHATKSPIICNIKIICFLGTVWKNR